MPAFALKFLPTNAWVRVAFPSLLVYIALATDRNYLCDFWHHLARGQYIAEQGQLLNHDQFTFTVADQPIKDVNWLSQLLYFRLFEVGGLDLVYQINALVLAVTLGLVVYQAWKQSGSVAVSAIVGVLVFLGLWETMTIRPQSFSLLLFVLSCLILEASARRPWLLTLLPLLIALWANVHGAFPAGLLLIGCYLATSLLSWKSPNGKLNLAALSICLAMSALATLANPYGWEIYQYVALTSGRASARRIDEWVPPNFQQMTGVAFFASLGLTAFLGILSWRHRSRWLTVRSLVLCGLFVVLAAGSVRMVAWWWLVLAPVLAAMLGTLLSCEKLDKPEDSLPSWSAGLVFSAFLVAIVFCVPGLREYNPALQFTRSGPRLEDDLESVRGQLPARSGPVRIFSRMEWGEYLGWSFPPTARVFVDGRIEIYPDDVWDDFSSITCGKENWQRLLDQYSVDVLVLDEEYHAGTGLLGRVRNSADWRQVAQSRDVLLFLRANTSGSTAGRIAAP